MLLISSFLISLFAAYLLSLSFSPTYSYREEYNSCLALGACLIVFFSTLHISYATVVLFVLFFSAFKLTDSYYSSPVIPLRITDRETPLAGLPA